MLRDIIQIDESLCDGCGLCVTACHEGAIGLVDGKAKLLRDDYCDGLGDCLPACPTGAITFETREAAAYDAVAVQTAQASSQQSALACGCPGSQARVLQTAQPAVSPTPKAPSEPMSSALRQWPVQIKLVPLGAPYLEGADLLIAADCAAYAHGNFHQEFMRDKITLIGCPKLDEGDYSEKLTMLFQQHDIRSVSVVRMEVPCCSGIEHAVKTAINNCGKRIPYCQAILATDGQIREG